MYRQPRRTVTSRMGPKSGFGNGLKMRLLIGLAIAAFAVFSYMGKSEFNPITGENQRVSLTEEQEIAMGLQAVPTMMEQHGGLYPDQELQDYIDEVGFKIVRMSDASETDYEYEFHLLHDPNTINAFALPGGQVFITAALYGRMTTEGQLAAVLGHEVAHVVARHGAQRMAKSDLTNGLIGAVAVGAGDIGAQRMAAMIGNMVNMKYGRGDELQSDTLGVQFMVDAGYDPRAMIEVQEILQSASGGERQPEFFSTHPDPVNRIGEIQETINAIFPNGVPDNLIP